MVFNLGFHFEKKLTIQISIILHNNQLHNNSKILTKIDEFVADSSS
jgi:hypothetical protein